MARSKTIPSAKTLKSEIKSFGSARVYFPTNEEAREYARQIEREMWALRGWGLKKTQAQVYSTYDTAMTWDEVHREFGRIDESKAWAVILFEENLEAAFLLQRGIY